MDYVTKQEAKSRKGGTGSTTGTMKQRKKIKEATGTKRGILPSFPCCCMFVGLSKSGKSTLVKELLMDPKMLHGYFQTIVFLSPTSGTDETIIRPLDLPKENVIKDFSEEKLDEIIQAQKKVVENKGWNYARKHNRILLIIDDAISNQKFLRSKTMMDLCALCRHYHISTFFLIQSYKMVARACRINMRGLALFQSNRDETDRIVDERCSSDLKKREFRSLLADATNEPYSFLWINQDKPVSDGRYWHKFDRMISTDDYKGK